MTQRLAERYETLFEQFLKISQREKLLILLSGVVVIGMLGYLFFIEPNVQQATRDAQNISASQNQVQSLEAQIQVIELALDDDPDKALSEMLSSITHQADEIDLFLQQQTVNLVTPKHMPMVLEEVLAKSQGVTLVSMQSILPTPVLKDDSVDIESESEEVSEKSDINLYRHGVKLVIRGSYFDIQGYLSKIEQLKWKFYWKRFNYVVNEYPNAVVEVELYTLSTSQAFIGV
jgi:MSHA biogenesis protein MshJ